MIKDLVEKSRTKVPSRLSRAFPPDDRTIRNFIIKFTYDKHKHQSKIDQNALKILSGKVLKTK